MKTREHIITSMCLTWRHDYGLERDDRSGLITSGLTDQECNTLWSQMAQLFDNNISPYMEFKE